MTRKFKLFFYLLIPICLFSFGCAQNSSVGLLEGAITNSKKVYRGKIITRSNAARTISIEVLSNGQTSTRKFDFDDKTRGIDHAFRGSQVLVTYKVSAGRTLATSIKPVRSGFVAGVSEITVNNVRKLIDDNDDFILIDSRDAHRFARSHLPSAISIPSCELEKHLARLPEKDQLLVFYCSGPTCGISATASAEAAYAGYRNIRVMLAGVEGWSEAGYPTYASDDFVTRGNAVLIDLRAARKNTVNRIVNSVSIPFDTLDDRIDTISKKAPIVVYSDRMRESVAALTRFREAGFRSVSMIEGNFKGWKKRDRPVTSGPIVTKINWKRKIGKNEISPAAFKKAMNSRTDSVILDVRTSEETAAGKLQGAKLIPLFDINERREELPKNKKIYIYCATGARADAACRQLKAKGYDAYFLVADVSCRNGDCKIEY